MDEAEMLNERRFLSLDPNYGRRVSSGMYEYLRDNGMTGEEYDFFLTHNLREHCVIGNDYYAANEHLLVDETRRLYGGEIFGYYVVTKDYYERYNLPVMHTETNTTEPDAERWLWKTWANVQRQRRDGVPMSGMTMVQPHPSSGLGHGAQGGRWSYSSGWTLRPRPQDPPGRSGLQKTYRTVE